MMGVAILSSLSVAPLMAASIAVMAVTVMSGDFADLPRLKHPIAVIAHRAGRGIAPENTLAAIRKAIALKVDYVELDIRATKDGHLVIMHDRTVDRTTKGTGAVKDLTLAEIRALDAGSKFDATNAGERVPTFEEVLKLCRGKVHIYVDHKEAPTVRSTRDQAVRDDEGSRRIQRTRRAQGVEEDCAAHPGDAEPAGRSPAGRGRRLRAGSARRSAGRKPREWTKDWSTSAMRLASRSMSTTLAPTTTRQASVKPSRWASTASRPTIQTSFSSTSRPTRRTGHDESPPA